MLGEAWILMKYPRTILVKFFCEVVNDMENPWNIAYTGNVSTVLCKTKRPLILLSIPFCFMM